MQIFYELYTVISTLNFKVYWRERSWTISKHDPSTLKEMSVIEHALTSLPCQNSVAPIKYQDFYGHNRMQYHKQMVWPESLAWNECDNIQQIHIVSIGQV